GSANTAGTGIAGREPEPIGSAGTPWIGTGSGKVTPPMGVPSSTDPTGCRTGARSGSVTCVSRGAAPRTTASIAPGRTGPNCGTGPVRVLATVIRVGTG